MEKMIIKPVGITMVMRGDCPVCKKKICETAYESLHDFNLKKAKWREHITKCPHCGEKFKEERIRPKLYWGKGNIAEATNGFFEVYKSGRGWRWYFRYYNEKEPRVFNQGFSWVKEVAKQACQNHKEWK